MLSNPEWIPTDSQLRHVNELVQTYRSTVTEFLQPLVETYHPGLLHSEDGGYRKMIELSTKMTLVGHACTAIAGRDFDRRRQMTAALYGGCCFLADGFLDDFGMERTTEYIQRFERLLQSGWFTVETESEQLFYVIVSRLFYQRDIFDPTLRQAIILLFLAQKRDVELRSDSHEPIESSRRHRLRFLEECARNRSGHAIIVLAALLVPDIPLALRHTIFQAGSLIMHIDDHGDCYNDRRHNRLTFMNQLRYPERTLRHKFYSVAEAIYRDIPVGEGRELLLGFLYRYYVTRLNKHRIQRDTVQESWAVYE